MYGAFSVQCSVVLVDHCKWNRFDILWGQLTRYPFYSFLDIYLFELGIMWFLPLRSVRVFSFRAFPGPLSGAVLVVIIAGVGS